MNKEKNLKEIETLSKFNNKESISMFEAYIRHTQLAIENTKEELEENLERLK